MAQTCGWSRPVDLIPRTGVPAISFLLVCQKWSIGSLVSNCCLVFSCDIALRSNQMNSCIFGQQCVRTIAPNSCWKTLVISLASTPHSIAPWDLTVDNQINPAVLMTSDMFQTESRHFPKQPYKYSRSSPTLGSVDWVEAAECPARKPLPPPWYACARFQEWRYQPDSSYCRSRASLATVRVGCFRKHHSIANIPCASDR